MNMIYRKSGKPTRNCHLTQWLLSCTWNLTAHCGFISTFTALIKQQKNTLLIITRGFQNFNITIWRLASRRLADGELKESPFVSGCFGSGEDVSRQRLAQISHITVSLNMLSCILNRCCEPFKAPERAASIKVSGGLRTMSLKIKN